jgi:hypothetical protein
MKNSRENREKRGKVINLDFVDWVLAIDCWPTRSVLRWAKIKGYM